MQRNDVVKGVFIVVPVAVLYLLYGLWLVMDTPVYVESLIVGAAVLLMVSIGLLEYALDKTGIPVPVCYAMMAGALILFGAMEIRALQKQRSK